MKTLCLTVVAFIMAASNLSAATHYVSLESTNPTPPYTNWVTAATNIQDAVDVAGAGDIVLVTNGVYAVGERDVSVLDTNQQPPQLVSVGLSRVVVTNSVRLKSVNGPMVTTIEGVGYVTNGVRCVFLGTDAELSGFTLTKGIANSGGGLYCASASAAVSNCVLTRNTAYYGCGGVGGTLYNCTVSSNGALWGRGGGAMWCTLNNCAITGNRFAAHLVQGSRSYGGGAYGCTLHDCTVTSNSVATTAESRTPDIELNLLRDFQAFSAP